jgi:hypothetical protein
MASAVQIAFHPYSLCTAGLSIISTFALNETSSWSACTESGIVGWIAVRGVVYVSYSTPGLTLLLIILGVRSGHVQQ